MCVCVRARACVRACVCVRARACVRVIDVDVVVSFLFGFAKRQTAHTNTKRG